MLHWLLPKSPKPIYQKLVPLDQAEYGEPARVLLRPPVPTCDRTRIKLEQWIAWRAAPYPAERHSEYLDIPGKGSAKLKILLSAVMKSPPTMDAYLAEISSKRRYDVQGKKAIARGYVYRPIQPRDHGREIYEIIHSSTIRQGRPISPEYADRMPDFAFPDYEPTGNVHFDDLCMGVFAPDGALVAYLLGKRVGDHVQYDEIMGHADHVGADVMYLLHWGFLELCSKNPAPPACLNYGPWYSGTDPFSPEGGLNRWKRKVKFTPAYLVLASS